MRAMSEEIRLAAAMGGGEDQSVEWHRVVGGVGMALQRIDGRVIEVDTLRWALARSAEVTGLPVCAAFGVERSIFWVRVWAGRAMRGLGLHP